MKSLGVKQLEAKQHKHLPKLAGFEALLGDLAYYFMAIVYGDPGQGKTEFCMQLARAICEHEDVAWISYEQGHSYSLKKSALRQKFDEAPHAIRFIDPIDKTKKVDIYEELKKYLAKKSTPRFVFIDSLNYINISVDDYHELNRLYGHKRTMIFISHAKGRRPDTKTGEKLAYDGELVIYVKAYLAYAMKNRGGADTPYIIWEEKAREKNEVYFAKLDVQQQQQTKRKRKQKGGKA